MCSAGKGGSVGRWVGRGTDGWTDRPTGGRLKERLLPPSSFSWCRSCCVHSHWRSSAPTATTTTTTITASSSSFSSSSSSPSQQPVFPFFFFFFCPRSQHHPYIEAIGRRRPPSGRSHSKSRDIIISHRLSFHGNHGPNRLASFFISLGFFWLLPLFLLSPPPGRETTTTTTTNWLIIRYQRTQHISLANKQSLA